MNRIFAALSDPTRRSILSMLARGDLSAGEIAEAFAISRPSISHHLSVLKGADLIESRREGQSLIYSIHTTVLEDALAGFLGLVRAGEKRPERDEGGKT
jgi:ArsR family transcriptional regulator, arsenate/arsenite/antimonite-responsive transcriptional repressor